MSGCYENINILDIILHHTVHITLNDNNNKSNIMRGVYTNESVLMSNKMEILLSIVSIHV